MMTSDAPTIESMDIDSIPVNTVPPEVEKLILWSFGKSIIEFEATLYEKFHILSEEIVLSKNEFLWHLENMAERHVLKSITFKGIPSWSRLL
ncbi:MAG: hypothetical protein ACW98Y_10645 [Candidatus Thorarchaeota archaeon]|jgi:hypothetical protein